MMPTDPSPSFATALVLAVALTVTLGLVGPVGGAIAGTSTMDATGDRSLTTDVVAPGGGIQVTVDLALDDPSDVTIEETFDGAVAEIEVVDDSGAESVSVDEGDPSLEATYSAVESVTLVYRITVDPGAELSETVSINGSVSGDVTHDLGVSTITVDDDPGVAIWFDDLPDEVVAESPVTVTAMVENLGPDNTAASVTLRADGSMSDDRLVAVEGFGITEVTLEWLPTRDEIGTVDLEASTATHATTASVTVVSPATFSLTDLSAPTSVAQFDPFTATVIVENVGDVEGTQTISLGLDDGTDLDSTTITLGVGESTEVTFTDLAIDTAGIHILVASSANAETDRPIAIDAADANVELPDQVIGTDTAGDPAVFLDDVVMDGDWYVALAHGDTVIATVDPETGLSGERLVVPVEASDSLPGPVTAMIVPSLSGFEVGASVPGGLTPLASDEGAVIDGYVTAETRYFVDAIDVLVIERARLDGGPAGDQPFHLTLERTLDDGSAEVIGVSEPIWGAADRIVIELDEPITDVGEHDLTVRFNESRFGSPSAAYVRLDGEEVVPMTSSIRAILMETPLFAIEAIDAPSEVVAGDRWVVNVTVANVGNLDGTQTVWLSLGQQVSLVDVTLAPGEVETVTFSVAISQNANGDTVAYLEVGGVSERLEVTVTDPPDATGGSSSIPGFTAALGAIGVVLAALVGWRRWR